MKDNCTSQKGLDRAYQLLQFEIELYWQRSLYFSGFISLIFIALQNADNIALQKMFLTLGFIVSFAWYLSTRGSKFWQENYEYYVALFEKENKQIIFSEPIKNKKRNFLDLCSPQRFSVSRINTLVALSITFGWLVMIVFSDGWIWLLILNLIIACIFYFAVKHKGIY